MTEDLYQQARNIYYHFDGMSRDALRAVVDFVLDADRQPWEVMREAAVQVIRLGHDPSNLYTVLHMADYLTVTAGRLEAEHQAAQEKAAAEAEREKLIEQAAREIEGFFGTTAAARNVARTLAEVGLLAAPETTDGGAK